MAEAKGSGCGRKDTDRHPGSAFRIDETVSRANQNVYQCVSLPGDSSSEGKIKLFRADSDISEKSGFLRVTVKLVIVCEVGCDYYVTFQSYIVRIVKEQLGMRTLAIGDGANDVSMIQTADVGVGISGHEGTQAVMAADFAVSRFSMLSRLLLLHGHWCYDRLARMILYFFHKNATFVFLVFWFQVQYP